MSQVTISLEEINKDLKERGLRPFTMGSFSFDARDEKHLELSVMDFMKLVHDWILQQEFKQP
ncbi:MAG: hypothetical protein PHP00_03325 [Thiotrichaceae bacterium]|nr:hypothetical protein [Thiotrichaceae bacterium]